jgi:hypothetical protein
MLARTEKRSNKRVASNAHIIFSLFSTRFWCEYPSMTRNHSESGMCFESSHPMMPGTNLFIRSDQRPNLHSNVRLRSTTLAEVMWCQKLSDEDPNSYCVGAKYY